MTSPKSRGTKSKLPKEVVTRTSQGSRSKQGQKAAGDKRNRQERLPITKVPGVEERQTEGGMVTARTPDPEGKRTKEKHAGYQTPQKLEAVPQEECRTGQKQGLEPENSPSVIVLPPSRDSSSVQMLGSARREEEKVPEACVTSAETHVTPQERAGFWMYVNVKRGTGSTLRLVEDGVNPKGDGVFS